MCNERLNKAWVDKQESDEIKTDKSLAIVRYLPL